MNTPADLDVENRLRATLVGRADDLPAYTDPFTRFARLDRRHTIQRRAKRGGVIVTALAVVGVLGSGLVPLPSWAPAININQASSPLLKAPTVGSLASDEVWVDAFRRQVPVLLADYWAGDSDGQWRVDGADNVHIVFAGDVGGERLALAAFPVRLGVLRENTSMWFRGPVGSSPAELAGDAGGGPFDSATVSRLSGETTADALLIAPTGTTAEFSTSAVIQADGTVTRAWLSMPRQSGGEYFVSTPWNGLGVPQLRVMLPGQPKRVTAFDVGSGRGVGSGLDAKWQEAVARSAEAFGLDAAHRQVVEEGLWEVLVQTGLDPGTTSLTWLWSGTSAGGPAVLVAAQPAGGGMLTLALTGTLDPAGSAGPDTGNDTAFYQVSTDLRLVAPAQGALTRPYAWRLRNPGTDDTLSDAETSRRVAVVVPPGASRAQLVTAGGKKVPVPLDGRYGTAALPGDMAATVIALDAADNPIATTPVPPWDRDYYRSMPGESAATSVVLAERSAP